MMMKTKMAASEEGPARACKLDDRGHYRAALARLADWLHEGGAMAEVMEFFARQLRGAPMDLDGPQFTALPTPSAVLRALQRIDASRAELDREWDRLSEQAREGLLSPDALGGGCDD